VDNVDTGSSAVIFVDVQPNDPRLEKDMFPVLKELRRHLTPESFLRIYEQGFEEGLRFSAVYLEHSCVGVSGWRIMNTTSFGRKLYVDDLVTTADARGQGIGSYILAQLAARAKEEGCSVLDLDSGVQRQDAHRFYLREGLANSALHFGRLIK
jgi:GNAT superfamily N-acetyltransferase